MTKGVSFSPDKDIPDLSGKVILVTGGNTGLGFEVIYQLSKHKPKHIYLAARSEEKANEAIKTLREKHPNAGPITFFQLDLGSFASIKAAAASFRSMSDRLDILINNAGIMAFGTNHLGPALFTTLLLPTLKATATISTDARVIFLSSELENMAPKNSYLLDELKTTLSKFSTWTRYGQSKLAAVHYAQALANHNPDLKVEGTLNHLWTATSPDVKSGVFSFPVGVQGKGSSLSKNSKLRDQLWEWTQKELEPHVTAGY
ncbi:alcohol dehydrogenase Bli-4 [Fusarium subglutinans]|uniref:Alcohol dehydrogenase Bli-4 n=1 Tax=Gibberella subglutinans TaxID=42677 RepID=A0A8H5Q201_GIBSU|nr:alcohol dehydrogenase Bli-4 [Fusarium subglutinans]KAF5606562.1 alcohol dehydrogenase Bli-4 [Fusarium subglutinans]